MSLRRSLLMLLLLPAVAAAQPGGGATAGGSADEAPCQDRREQVFISPMGEPFRAPAGAPAPAGAWFAGADADHDGRLTAAEMVADADRFFARLDRDHDGEIAPDEVAEYENRIAPEIRMYQGGFSGRGPVGRGEERARDRQEQACRNPKGGDVYDGEKGAGRFAWLNIPEPVASADQDFNRGISRQEFRDAALARFRLLDSKQAKALTLAGMPALPARPAACPPPGKKRRGGRRG